jgi:catechol 2,3-dioxygenase-like lactoylglutathione lyase family enzyme
MTSVIVADPAFGLSRVGQIGITVHDLDRAIAFYRDTLGMRFLFRAPNLAFFDCDGLRLMLGLPERPEHNHPASILYYRADDLRAAHAVLLVRGVTFLDEPHLIARMPDHELWMAFFTDTEGNTLGLMSEVR